MKRQHHYTQGLLEQIAAQVEETGAKPSLIRLTPHQARCMRLKGGDRVVGVPVKICSYGSVE